MEEGSLSFAEGDGHVSRAWGGWQPLLGGHPDRQCASRVECLQQALADSAEAAGALPSKRGDVFQKPRRQLEMEGQSKPGHR